MNRTFIKNKNKVDTCRKYSISPQELSRIFKEWMRMMEPQRRNRVVIAKPPEPRIKPAPVIAPRAPQPQPRRVAVAPPKQRKPREKKPLVITITVLHTPDETGNDVLFARSGTPPADIDVDALEQWVADFFGQEEYDDEELCEEEEEYEDE
jgi:hypothetical protein